MLQIGHRTINQLVRPNIVKAQIQRLCRQLELARNWVFREESELHQRMRKALRRTHIEVGQANDLGEAERRLIRVESPQNAESLFHRPHHKRVTTTRIFAAHICWIIRRFRLLFFCQIHWFFHCHALIRERFFAYLYTNKLALKRSSIDPASSCLFHKLLKQPWQTAITKFKIQ